MNSRGQKLHLCKFCKRCCTELLFNHFSLSPFMKMANHCFFFFSSGKHGFVRRTCSFKWKCFLMKIETIIFQVKMESSASGQDVYPHRGVLIRYSAQVIIIVIIVIIIIIVIIVTIVIMIIIFVVITIISIFIINIINIILILIRPSSLSPLSSKAAYSSNSSQMPQ